MGGRRPLGRDESLPGAATVSRGSLSASLIAAAFGVAWSQWAASGLPTEAGEAVRVIGIVLGVTVIARVVRVWRLATLERTSMFRSPGYRVVVIMELLALLSGFVWLSRTGRAEFVPAWVAAVVGAHFLAFGRLIADLYYWVGGTITTGGVAAAAVGIAGGSSHAVDATAGLSAAITLFAVATWRTFKMPIGPKAPIADSDGEGVGS